MASVHEIGIAADTREFDEGVRSGIIKPLEKAEDAFKDLERAASDAGRDGARDVGKLEDALDDARKQSKKLEESVDDVGSKGKMSLDKVKGGAEELQTEFGANLGETVSSFKGDLGDLGQIGQDTLGGLAATVSSMGPAGLLGAFALAAGALGLGAINAGMEEAEQRQEDLSKAADDWAAAYESSAGRIVDAASVVAGMNAIATDGEKYKEAGENAKNWGVDVSTAMLAMAGDATALGTVQESLTAKQDAYTKSVEGVIKAGDGYAASTGQLTAEQMTMRDEVVKGKEAFDFQNEAMGLGAERARNQAQALYEYTQRAGEATGETDDLGNAVYKLPDGKEIVIDANTKTAYADLDAIEKRQLSGKTISIGLDTSDFDRKMDAINRRAAEGISVVVNPTLGRVIQ